MTENLIPVENEEVQANAEPPAPEPEAVQEAPAAEVQDTAAPEDAAEPAEDTEDGTDAAESGTAEPPVVRAFIGAEHRCVVDEDNLFIAFCVCNLFSVGDDIEFIPQGGYKVPDGCCLLDAKPPTMRMHAGTSGFISPKWDEDTEAWIEAATAEQIAAWEAEHPDPVPLEYKRAAKTAEMSAACNAAINAGTTVQMPDGTQEAFTYSTADQANVSEMFMACLMGAESYPYHANDEACKSYTAAEIMSIYGTLSMYKTGQLTYHNQLKQYINALETVQEVQAVTYGQELTGEYLAAYGTLMQEAQAQMQAVISKVGGANAGG